MMRSRSAVTTGTRSGTCGAQLDALFLEQLAHRRDRVLDDLLQVDRARVPLDVARLELARVEHLVDEPRQALGFLDDDAEEARALGRLEVRVVAQDLGERADRGQRRAQLVRHGRDEVVLQPVELLQALVGRAQLRGRVLELAAISAPAGGCRRPPARPRRGCSRTSSMVSGSSFTTEADHDARRGRADRAGELHLDVVHELGIGGERLVRPAQAALARVVARRPRRRAPRPRKRASRSCRSGADAVPRQKRAPPASPRLA